MKKVLITTAAALSLSGGISAAQQSPDLPATSPPQSDADRTPAPPPPGSRGPSAGDGNEWRMSPMRDRTSPRERGARFRIENGRTTIDLRCADGEPTKDCADLLLQVLDRLQGGSSSEDNDGRGYDREQPRFR